MKLVVVLFCALVTPPITNTTTFFTSPSGLSSGSATTHTTPQSSTTSFVDETGNPLGTSTTVQPRPNLPVVLPGSVFDENRD